MRDIEDTEKEGEKPVHDCLIADCGELPRGTDLASIPTFIAEVRPAVRLLMPAHYQQHASGGRGRAGETAYMPALGSARLEDDGSMFPSCLLPMTWPCQPLVKT